MTDENVARSFLYQGVELAPGTYRLNIDFRSLLSTEEPLGFARDTFFASIYLSSTPELFNPRQPAGFDSFLSLFDFDAAGPYDFSGNFSINPMRTDYLIYSQNISLAETATLFTVFELTDLNGINDNSLVLVDSVVILIPEPESALLAGLVALIFLLIHRRRHP